MIHFSVIYCPLFNLLFSINSYIYFYLSILTDLFIVFFALFFVFCFYLIVFFIYVLSNLFLIYGCVLNDFVKFLPIIDLRFGVLIFLFILIF